MEISERMNTLGRLFKTSRLPKAVALGLATLLWLQVYSPVFAKANEQPECSILKQSLETSWQGYKDFYTQADGRVRDPNANDISTSESQAYGMLRAVWMNDQPAFDDIYQWAIDNLQVRQDKLFAWKWGKHPLPKDAPNNTEAKWAVLDDASASDADQDMALALILAHHRWGDERYLQDAQLLLNDIWRAQVKNTRYFGEVMMPGDFEHQEDFWLVNPSYFWPLAYRVFAEMDPPSVAGHQWLTLIDSSYAILLEAISKNRTGLPPNWLKVAKKGAKKDNRVSLFWEANDQRSDYGYDAIRTHWRVGMDYMLTGSEQARQILYATNFLERFWWIRKALPSPLSIDGIARNLSEITSPSQAIYGATLPHLMLAYPTIGHAIVREYILSPLQANGVWLPEKDYYAQNWLWLGLWSYTGQLCGDASVRKQRSLRDNVVDWVPLGDTKD